jgi:hypothetical protein
MGKQEQIIGMLGPSNPIAGVVEWRNTATAIADAFGLKDTTKFFKEITRQVAQQLAQASGGQNKPDPAMMMAQAQLAVA